MQESLFSELSLDSLDSILFEKEHLQELTKKIREMQVLLRKCYQNFPQSIEFRSIDEQLLIFFHEYMANKVKFLKKIYN